MVQTSLAHSALTLHHSWAGHVCRLETKHPLFQVLHFKSLEWWHATQSVFSSLDPKNLTSWRHPKPGKAASWEDQLSTFYACDEWHSLPQDRHSWRQSQAELVKHSLAQWGCKNGLHCSGPRSSLLTSSSVAAPAPSAPASSSSPSSSSSSSSPSSPLPPSGPPLSSSALPVLPPSLPLSAASPSAPPAGPSLLPCALPFSSSLLFLPPFFSQDLGRPSFSCETDLTQFCSIEGGHTSDLEICGDSKHTHACRLTLDQIRRLLNVVRARTSRPPRRSTVGFLASEASLTRARRLASDACSRKSSSEFFWGWPKLVPRDPSDSGLSKLFLRAQPTCFSDSDGSSGAGIVFTTYWRP